jgi:hypothetical protein
MKSVSSSDSINENVENFNPDKLTVEEMLKGVKDSDGKAYYQSVNENEKIKPINIETDSVPNFEKMKDLKQWIFDNLKLIGNIEIKSNKKVVQFSKTSLNRSLKGVNRNNVKKNSYSGLRELVENSIYGGERYADKRHENKVKGQELYYNAFNHNGKTYGVEIVIDIPKTKNTPNNYAGHKIKEIKIAPVASEVSSNELTFDKPDATISITDIQKLFNPKTVHLYNITEYQTRFQDDNTNSYKNNEQNVKEYNYIHNQITGEKINIEMNDDIKVDKIEPKIISSKLPFKISKKPSDNKKNLIKTLNLRDGNKIQAININTKEQATITSRSIEKSLSNANINTKNYRDFCIILNNIKELFETSEKVLSHKDAKDNLEMDIKRYANITRIGDNNYLLEFVLKDNGNISLYSVDVLDKKEQ